MAAVSRLQILLGELARRNGMHALQADDEGRFHILVDDAPVACFERFGRLHLVSPLGAPPEAGEARRAWLRRLLNQALGRMKHNRSTPALEETGEVILFARCGLADLSVQELEARIEEHVNSLLRYRRALVANAPMPRSEMARSFVRP